MTDDRLEKLEEQRRFLLESLDDLEREHAAGDIDDHDYRSLRDDYTARAAATLRAIEDGQVVESAAGADWLRRAMVIAVSVALIAGVWWALSSSWAQRLPGQEITGADPRSSIEIVRAQARAAQFRQPAQAAELYQTILEDDPDDANALTYGGWTRALAAISTGGDGSEVQADLIAASEMLSRAIEVEPDYPDPYCLRGVLLSRFLEQDDAALGDLQTCLDGDPPADIAALVEPLVDEIETGSSSPDQ